MTTRWRVGLRLPPFRGPEIGFHVTAEDEGAAVDRAKQLLATAANCPREQLLIVGVRAEP